MNAKLSKVNQSIEKTIQIVEVMARGKGPMRLQDVAKKCGMPASTVMRMLNTLQVYGYVNQDPCTQHYSLSLRFARLGCLVSEQTNMRDVARPFLAELAQRCQETVCLWCEAEMEVECTDVVDGPDGILMVSQRVGARAPLHATGAGKLLLLNYSNQKLNEYIGNGQPCTVIGHSERGLERCRKSIEQNWDDLIAEGLATEGNKQAAMALVTITNDPAALQEHTFVFEAVAEGTEEKRAVYETIEQNAAPNVVIASCTSSIDAEILAGLVSHPERLLIAHPFQPVHMLPLVEVVRHEKTAEDTVTRTLALLETLHRQVVVLNRSVPGFLVNRFAQALFRESIYLIEQGVTTAADIDRAVKYAVGMRYASIGLLEYFDAVGYELESAIAKNVYPDLCGTRELQQLVLDGLATGKTGQAAGQGLYDWSQKDADDFRRRKQSPYFAGVKEWAMPDVK